MSWTVDRITAKCEEFSAMVGDTYDCPIVLNKCLNRTLSRVIIETERGIAKPIKIEFFEELLNTLTDASIISVIGHAWAHYYVTKTTGVNHKHNEEFKRVCSLIGYVNDMTVPELKWEDSWNQNFYAII